MRTGSRSCPQAIGVPPSVRAHPERTSPMPFMPFDIIWIWLRGLLSLALIGLGIYLVRDGYERCYVREIPVAARASDTRDQPEAAREGSLRWVGWHPGFNRQTLDMVGGPALLLWSVVGGPFLLPLLR